MNYKKVSDAKLKVIDDISTLFKISDKAYEDLAYYMHDDSHVDGSTLKEVIKVYGELNPITLYRGCSDKELESLIETGKPNSGYSLSFSESRTLAKHFGNNIIKLKPNSAKGFCLWQFYAQYCDLATRWCRLHGEDPFDFLGDTPEGYMDFILSEKEWIFDKNTRWICIDEDKLIFAEDTSKVKTKPAKLYDKLFEIFSNINGMKCIDDTYVSFEVYSLHSKYNTVLSLKKLCKEIANKLNIEIESCVYSELIKNLFVDFKTLDGSEKCGVIIDMTK